MYLTNISRVWSNTGFDDLPHGRNIKLVSNNMEQGVIARLTDKGFGFISREGEEKDVFFHSSELVDIEYNSLQEGDKVEFEVKEGPKGLNAVSVKKVA